MQCMPLMLRQSFRYSLHRTRTPSGPVRAAQLRPAIPSGFTVTRAPTRNFSVCLQCQFRRQPGLYSSSDEKKDSVNTQNAAEELKEAANAREEVSISGDVGGSHATLSQTEIPAEQPETEKLLYEEPTKGSSVHVEGTQNGGLPSYLESRRSRVSKQFTTLMDNLQSNIFVAGQRLNDLTGYSSIEALKKEIQFQGTPHPLRRSHQTLITNNQHREPTPQCPSTGQKSERRLRRRDQQPLCLTARSQRAPATETLMVAHRPGALYTPVSQRPRK